MRRLGWAGLALAVLALWLWQQHAALPPAAPGSTPVAHTPAASAPAVARAPERWPAFLPPEARATLRRIDAGGPFAHRQDGAVFGNRERLLPPQPRGYYHEYTVETPGAGDRGPRRIVTGGTPPREYFYSADHYRSFRRFTAGDTR